MFRRKRKQQADPANPVSNLTPIRKRKAIVALDIDGETLRIAQATGQGASARINRLLSTRLDLPADKKDQAPALGAALKKALAELRIKPKEVVLSIPRGQIVLRPLQVPMVADVRELASVINFQIAKELPFRVEEATVDFKVLRVIESAAQGEASSNEPRQQLEVLVGAVKSDVVRFYREAAQRAGFKLAGLGLRPVAAAQCAPRSQPPDAVFLLVSLRDEEVTLDIIDGGKLLFSRVAVIDRDDFLKSLEIEVVRSLHSFEGAPGSRSIGKVLVAGGTGREAEVLEALSTRLKLPGEILDGRAWSGNASLESAEAAASIAPVSLALSVLDPAGLAIDFANPKKPAVKRDNKRLHTILAAAAAVAVLITLFGARANLVKKRTEVKTQIQTKVNEARTRELPVYRRVKTQARTVNTWVADEQNWLDHFAYLSAILPPADQLYISAFTTTPQHLIRFSVQSKSGELLAQLDKQLRAAGYEVKPLSITPANDRHGYNFRTTVELSIPRKMKPKLDSAKPPARPADDAGTIASSTRRTRS